MFAAASLLSTLRGTALPSLPLSPCGIAVAGICCAAARANIEIIEREGLVGNAERVGAHLPVKLKLREDHPIVGEVAGLGLPGRLQTTADKATRKSLPAHLLAGGRIAAEMRARRVIMRQLPNDVPS